VAERLLGARPRRFFLRRLEKHALSNALSHAVRQVKGGRWQVSLIAAAHWRTCKSEHDARVIANGLNLAAAVRCGDQTDEEPADELEKAAGVAVQNLGECWAVQLIRISASLAHMKSRKAPRNSILVCGA
jgi:hypothetical protein